MRNIIEIINQIRSTSSSNAKQDILKKNKDNELLKKILKYTYDPYLKYGFSEKKLLELLSEYKIEFIKTWEDGFDMLDTLARENINDDLRSSVLEFLSLQPSEEVKNLYIGILVKDLKLGMNVKSINKVFKDLIPTFNIMLAESYFKQKEGFLNGREFILTTKLDGIRLVTIKENGVLKFYTRQGQLVEGLVDIESELKDIPDNIVLDGELLLENENNSSSDELYRATMKVARKDGIKQNLEFHVFDCVDLKDFKIGKSEQVYVDRKLKLKEITQGKKWIKEVAMLYKGNDENKIVEHLNIAKSNNQEGIMLNLSDGIYECKRSKNILKVKVMQTCDLKIIGFEEGEGNFKGILGAAIVEYKNNTVGVGSGWSLEDRKEVWGNRDKYIGRVLEVQYFEESTDSKTGLPSLRFPVKKAIREIGKEISYN